MDTEKTYLVGIGGQPSENHEEFDSLEDAENRCLEMAEEMATEQGIDPGTVDYVENTYGDETERVACPEGDDGAYWPHIEEI